MSEFRQLRVDIDNLRNSIVPLNRSMPPQVLIGTVTSNTTGYPVPGYVKVNVDSLSGTPTEGSAGTVSATGETVIVAVLGTAMPPTGSVIKAKAIGGRWVAQIACTTQPILSCGQCTICGISAADFAGATVEDAIGTFDFHSQVPPADCSPLACGYTYFATKPICFNYNYPDATDCQSCDYPSAIIDFSTDPPSSLNLAGTGQGAAYRWIIECGTDPYSGLGAITVTLQVCVVQCPCPFLTTNQMAWCVGPAGTGVAPPGVTGQSGCGAGFTNLGGQSTSGPPCGTGESDVDCQCLSFPGSVSSWGCECWYWYSLTSATYDLTSTDCASNPNISITIPISWTPNTYLATGAGSYLTTNNPNCGVAPATIWGSSVNVSFSTSFTCCQKFYVLGCNGLPLTDATVSVYDSEGGTLLTSDLTDSTGHITLYWIGNPTSCDAYVTATKCLFEDWGQNMTMVAGGSSTISMTPTASDCASTPCAPGFADPQTNNLFTVDTCTEEPCPGVTFTFNGQSYTTDDNGQVTLCGSYLMPINISAIQSEACSDGLGGNIQAIFPECTVADTLLEPSCELCTLNVTVLGCNGLPLPGAVVEAGSEYSNPVPLPVVTNSLGVATFQIPLGRWGAQATCGRFQSGTASGTFDGCPSTQNTTIQLLAGSPDFVCVSCSVVPMSTSIEVNDPYGLTELTYNTTDGYWEGTNAGVSYPGLGTCCAASTCDVLYQFGASCGLSVNTYTVQHGENIGCPTTVGTSELEYGWVIGELVSESVPTSCGLESGVFDFQFTFPGEGCETGPRIYPNGATATVMEG